MLHFSFLKRMMLFELKSEGICTVETVRVVKEDYYENN